jgi:hypothetical protein
MQIAKLGLIIQALVFILSSGGHQTAYAQLQNLESANSGRSDKPEQRQYTFSWKFEEQDQLAPRGGTTKGPDVELDRSVPLQFLATTDPELETFERDRNCRIYRGRPSTGTLSIMGNGVRNSGRRERKLY